jgi:SAM-dependent methyltransferase
MTAQSIRFDDGSAYEQYMGVWSRLVGESFLDWLAPGTGRRWLDVGCGNGAFTTMIAERCAPASIDGVDPSEEQLAFARGRLDARVARFRSGDAMALPYPDQAFDVAVMPLVIFFVPDPGRGVAEMVRVVSPGGIVAAYAWDMTEGGFPYDALHGEMRALGLSVPTPPSPEASRLEVLTRLWRDAGLGAIETRAFGVTRTYSDFEAYWSIVREGPSVKAKLATLSAGDAAQLRSRLRACLPADEDGSITCQARANAIRGRVPGAP